MTITETVQDFLGTKFKSSSSLSFFAMIHGMYMSKIINCASWRPKCQCTCTTYAFLVRCNLRRTSRILDVLDDPPILYVPYSCIYILNVITQHILHVVQVLEIPITRFTKKNQSRVRAVIIIRN